MRGRAAGSFDASAGKHLTALPTAAAMTYKRARSLRRQNRRPRLSFVQRIGIYIYAYMQRKIRAENVRFGCAHEGVSSFDINLDYDFGNPRTAFRRLRSEKMTKRSMKNWDFVTKGVFERCAQRAAVNAEKMRSICNINAYNVLRRPCSENCIVERPIFRRYKKKIKRNIMNTYSAKLRLIKFECIFSWIFGKLIEICVAISVTYVDYIYRSSFAVSPVSFAK